MGRTACTEPQKPVQGCTLPFNDHWIAKINSETPRKYNCRPLLILGRITAKEAIYPPDLSPQNLLRSSSTAFGEITAGVLRIRYYLRTD